MGAAPPTTLRRASRVVSLPIGNVRELSKQGCLCLSNVIRLNIGKGGRSKVLLKGLCYKGVDVAPLLYGEGLNLFLHVPR